MKMEKMKSKEDEVSRSEFSLAGGSTSSSSVPAPQLLIPKPDLAESSQAHHSKLHAVNHVERGGNGADDLRVGSTGPVFSLLSKEDRSGPLRSRPQRNPHVRSKSASWKEPLVYLQRLGSIGGPLLQPLGASGRYQQQPAYQPPAPRKEPVRKKLSAWGRLLKKLGLDGGKKVHAARAEWLNYDSQSYALNFEKEKDCPYAPNSRQMPKITGPGAREIVTVLLQRSSSHNRNSGSMLLPKPVSRDAHEVAIPLWQRRSVTAPASLDLAKFRNVNASRRRRRGTSM